MTAKPKDAAWVLRMGRHGVQILAVVLVLALVFTMVNVQQFAAQGHPSFGVQWWIAWLLDPMASLTMAAAIVFDGLLADYGKPKVHWLTATKWYAGVATWGMNIWASAAAGSLAGVWLHSVAPGLVLGLAEAAPRVRRHMAEIIAELEPKPEPVHAVTPVVDDLPARTYPRVGAPVAWSPPPQPPVVPAAPAVAQLAPDPVPVMPDPEPERVVEPEPMVVPKPVVEAVASSAVTAADGEAVEVADVVDPEPAIEAEPPVVAESSGAAGEPVASLEDRVRAILDEHGPLGRARIIALLPDPKPSAYQVRTVLERMRAVREPVLNGAGVKSGSAGSVGGADAA